jgi:hypothetical protein
MKSLFDDENMCRRRPKIALPVSGAKTCTMVRILVYYGLDTKLVVRP